MAPDAETPQAVHGWPVELQRAVTAYFTLDELSDLCLSLGIDFEELGEGAKSRRVFLLIRFVVLNGRLDELLDRCQEMRPRADEWAQIRAAAHADPDLFDSRIDLDTDDGDLIQLSGDFRGATINIDSGPFGSLLRTPRARRAAVAVAATVALLAGFITLNAMGVFKSPDKMQGGFNIAVAEFAVLDEAGRLTNGQHQGGKLLADRVAGTLRGEFADETDIQVWNDSPELAAEHRVKIGVAADEVAGARSPQLLAEELGADVLIYGRVEPASNLARQQLRFFLAPQFGKDFTNMVGDYVFSASIPVFDPARPSDEVWGRLDPLSKALAWLIQGLRLERLGRSSESLAAFERAATFTPDDAVVRYFIGQENLFLAQRTPGAAALDYEAAAEAALNESLRLDPNYARAIIGLGSLQTLRAQRLLETGKDPAYDGDRQAAFTDAQAEAQRALATYERVASQPEQIGTYGVPVRSIALLGQGIAWRILGDAAYRADDPATASEAINQAAVALETALSPLQESNDYRLMGQVNQALGSVYEWRGFLDKQTSDAAAEEAYDRARAYYEECRRLGDEFPIDEYLTERIVAQLCLPRLEELQQATGGG